MSAPTEVDHPLAYSAADCARLLGVNRTTIYGLVASGQLGSVKVGGRRLIPRAALLALLEVDANDADAS
jgi:excisionase family DNA binding protein